MRFRSLAALSLLVPSLAVAQARTLVLSHHGRLLSSSDEPVTSSVSLKISLFGAATQGTAVWTETYAVTPFHGAYSLDLGDTAGDKKPLTAEALTGERWVQVEVDGVVLGPRQRLTMTPYAVEAMNATSLGGAPAADYALKTYVDAAIDAVQPQGFARLDGAAFSGPVTVQAPTADAQPATKGYADAQVAAAKAYTDTQVTDAKGHADTQASAAKAYADMILADKFESTPAFAPSSGSVPFSVAAGANGMVSNLNAELLGGKPASDFLQAATYKPPVYGNERLVLNFDEGATSGTAVVDASGAGNDGSFPTSGVLRTSQGHNATGGLTFTAGAGLVTVPHSSSLAIANALTLEAWVFPTSYGTGSDGTSIVMKEDSYGLGLDPSGRVRMAIRGSSAGSWAWYAPSTEIVPLNAWSHVAATYDGVRIQTFLNGQVVGAVPAAFGPVNAATNPVTVGGRTAATNAIFIGTIDEVRVSAVSKPFAQGVVDRSPGDLSSNEVVTRVVGATPQSYTGRIVYTTAAGKRLYGRAATVAICQASFGPGARMCTAYDLMRMMEANAIRHVGNDATADYPAGAFNLPTVNTWINTGILKVQTGSGALNMYNDCFNWSGQSANGGYGANYYIPPSSTWPFGYTEPANCNVAYPLMCCK